MRFSYPAIHPLLVAWIVGWGTGAVLAQDSSRTAAPAFEVASVKLNTSGSRSSSLNTPPSGLVTAVNVPLPMLVMSAYRVHRLRLVGSTDSLEGKRFDIVAKRPGNASPDLVPLMLRSLLAERFNLRVHTEIREQPVYRLVLARGDGRLGPQLTRSSVDCVALDAARRANPPPAPPTQGQRYPCNVRASLTNGQGIISVGGRPVSELATSLVNMVDRVVVDRTGLTGAFDMEVRWGVATSAVPAGVAGDETLSIFTAFQEQLGLKLEPGREPIEVLVIDSAELPKFD